MLDGANYDPRPLYVRIIELLGKSRDGMTTKELAAQLGVWQPTVSAQVSKLHAYGAGVERIGPAYGQGGKWRLKP